MDNNYNTIPEKENVLAGTVGALLFSLVGGILWFVLYQFGRLAAISGLVGVICSIKGYTFFAKKESFKGIIIAIIAALVVLLIAWYLCLAKDVYDAHQEWYNSGLILSPISFTESVKTAHLYLEDSEIAGAYLTDLGIGLLLCAVGSASYIATAVKRIKLAKEAAQEQPYNDQQ